MSCLYWAMQPCCKHSRESELQICWICLTVDFFASRFCPRYLTSWPSLLSSSFCWPATVISCLLASNPSWAHCKAQCQVRKTVTYFLSWTAALGFELFANDTLALNFWIWKWNFPWHTTMTKTKKLWLQHPREPGKLSCAFSILSPLLNIEHALNMSKSRTVAHETRLAQYLYYALPDSLTQIRFSWFQPRCSELVMLLMFTNH